jgi:radical SAM superfamily enzyme YgiQ (UPF0313 family)
MADIVLINPRFEPSYWGLEYAMPFLGKRAVFPVAALPLLAALTPPESGHRYTIIDENVEPLDFARCASADIVGLTGMSVQRARMREILTELKRRGVFTVVGGAWVTLREDYFAELADVVFIGEAEETWPRFLEDWAHGHPARRYEQDHRTDMARVPVPRFDLLRMDRYAFSGIQFSRGCPFLCEFCDIIVTFGRKPRLKSVEQILTELDSLSQLGAGIVFIVDDNLIGNKRAIKPILREIASWQERHGYRFTFFTEASLDLADDPELIELMVAANLIAVFIGIESPDPAALIEAKKGQNLRGTRSIVEKVHAIQEAGLEVWCGMIVGFDHDGPEVFEAHRHFLAEARIIHSMTGMLNALPKTPLYERLARVGRLDHDDAWPFGTNILPLGMTREQLRDGYIELMRSLYSTDAYFDRFEELYLRGALAVGRRRLEYLAQHRWWRLAQHAQTLTQALVLFFRVALHAPEPALKRHYLVRALRLLRHRREPDLLLSFAIKCAIHVHVHTLIRNMRPGGKVANVL